MAFKISDYSVDKDLQEDGVWMELERGAFFKIAALSNRRVKRAYARFRKKRRNPSEQESEKFAIQVMAEHVLLDWRGDILDENDEPIPYSKEMAVEFLSQEPFMNLVTEHANDYELFSVAGEEDEATKN